MPETLKNSALDNIDRPDYAGGSIVNLMSSIGLGRGQAASRYAPLALLGGLDLSRYRTVLLLVIDGLGYDYLLQTGPDSTLASQLRGRLTSVFPTTTAAAITTFLTGLAPAQHGLTGWFVWLDEIRTVTAVLPFQGRIGGEPLQSRGHDIRQLLEPRPLYPQLDVRSHVVSPARIADSPFNQAFSAGATVHAFETLEQMSARLCAVVRADTSEKFIYAYWPDLDHLGHERGIGSTAATTHFDAIDTAFARLLDELEGSDTLVLVTADHGIIDAGPGAYVHLRDHAALTAMLDVPLCGEPRAAYCYIHAGEDAAFESYMATELGREASVVPSAALLEAGLFGPGEPHPRLARRVGDYTVLMNENFVISDEVPGEGKRELIGVHGGLSRAELYVPLCVAET